MADTSLPCFWCHLKIFRVAITGVGARAECVPAVAWGRSGPGAMDALTAHATGLGYGGDGDGFGGRVEMELSALVG